jgi:large subunit ribosomal protein L2
MSLSSMFCRQFRQQILNSVRSKVPASYSIQQNCNYWKPVNVPKPGIKGKSYRRIVHFKENYTVEPLEVTNLAGRDPVTGNNITVGFIE